jgi:small-conductance mechanosensitive channel
MGWLGDFLEQINWQDKVLGGLRILIIIAIALFAKLALRKALDRLEKKLVSRKIVVGETLSEAAKRIETIMKLVRQAANICLFGIIALILLDQFGVDIGPVLASAGVIGLAIGFGAQNLVKDVISGLFMLLENQVRVNDAVVINGTPGFVEQVNFRTLVLRDLGGVVHVFPNGQITTLGNMTNDWSAYLFDIGVAYKEDTDRVVEVLQRVGSEMYQDEYYRNLMLEDLEIFGVDSFGDSAVTIKGRLRTKPVKQWEVGRQFLRRVKRAFDEEGIEIPFPHRTLYFGQASKPFEFMSVDEKASEVVAQ